MAQQLYVLLYVQKIVGIAASMLPGPISGGTPGIFLVPNTHTHTHHTRTHSSPARQQQQQPVAKFLHYILSFMCQSVCAIVRPSET